jgi:hypothetical protein
VLRFARHHVRGASSALRHFGSSEMISKWYVLKKV